MSYRAASPRRRESMQTRHSTVFNWGRRGPYFQPSKAQVATGGRRSTTRAASSGRCRTARAAGARSGASAGGSDAPSSLASADLPDGEAILLAGKTHEGPDHAGFPGITGGRRLRGDLTRVVPATSRRASPRRRGAARRPCRAASGSCPRTARRTLRSIRMSSKDEPEERILRYLGEVSAEPVAHGCGETYRTSTRRPRARPGHPPFGWDRQDRLVAGCYASARFGRRQN